MDTTGIRLGVFVQHLLKAREAGTREPDSYALGAIAPRQVSERQAVRFLAPWSMMP